MSETQLQAVYNALLAGDRTQARTLLSDLAKNAPSADVFYYCAFAAKNKLRADQFLRQALKLDPFHSGANRLLSQLGKQGIKALRDTTPDPPTQTNLQKQTSEMVVDPKDLQRRHKQRGKQSRRSLFTFLIVGMTISLVSSWFVMFMLGLGAQFVNPVAETFGAEASITDYNGTPISEIDNPAKLPDLPSALSTALPRGSENATGEILRDGILHEYSFRARQGESVALAVQFFSPFAQDVYSNVAVFDPDGRDASGRCERQIIIDDKTGAAYICDIHVSGDWKVRIFGREGESSGVYIVTFDQIETD